MRVLLLSTLLLVCCSCVSHSQEQHAAFDQPVDSLRTDSITLLFAGDLMQHKEQIEAAHKKGNTYDYAECFREVWGQISKADIAIGNLEVTLAGAPYGGYPSFSAPDQFLFAIQQAGFDLLTTANNHCLDRGSRGVNRTNRLLDSLHLSRLGAYRDTAERQRLYPLTVEKNGFRIAFISYTEFTNGITAKHPTVVNYMDKAVVEADIAKVKRLSPDLIIAFMHWGVEYASQPNQKQKAWAEWLLSKGVAHVIGSHPHVVQPMELRVDSATQSRHLVVYSLGNFISNMSERGTDGGLMLHLTFVKDSTVRLAKSTYQPVWTWRPRFGSTNYKVIPATKYPEQLLSPVARYRMNQFVSDTRALMKNRFEE